LKEKKEKKKEANTGATFSKRLLEKARNLSPGWERKNDHGEQGSEPDRKESFQAAQGREGFQRRIGQEGNHRGQEGKANGKGGMAVNYHICAARRVRKIKKQTLGRGIRAGED